METLEQMNVKVYALRKEKADIAAEISEIQRKRTEKNADTQALDAEKIELVADSADIDRDLSIIGAKIKYLVAPMQERDKRADAIRLIVAALVTSGKPLLNPSKLIELAAQIEDSIQASLPNPVLPDIENYDED